ncbi:MAG: ABC transporter ATP-binding protein [Candidatus Promineifilaceae bacterium]|nr:ABC transporter ATP-binding protein [Candidatus Promineifilaceae bacterium]
MPTTNRDLPASAPIRCRHLVKAFAAGPAGRVVAVDDVSFDVPSGEILALLGPSGCGKTTTLRLVAGFERLDAGTIALGDETVAAPGRHLPPERRQIGMVFQDYAIFPHLSVGENVAFGLGGGRRERAKRQEALLDFVGLTGLAERMPHELSGGQQQRVALARALAPGPRALLLDEPFSNLDTALRAEVRAEVRALLRQTGTTTLFVTHDQQEALFLGDRVAVMQAGRVEQVGTPEEIFLRPKTRFVAAFLGQTDFVEGTVAQQGLETALGTLPLETGLPIASRVEVALRPDAVALARSAAGQSNARVISRQFLGIAYLYRLGLNDGSIVHSWQPHSVELGEGEAVRATLAAGHVPPIFHKERAVVS